MKKKRTKSILLLVITIVFVQAFLSGCNIKPDNTTHQPVTPQITQNNEEILKQANILTTANASVKCSYNSFKKYNIPKDVYNIIATSVYISDVEADIGVPLLRKTGENYYSIHCVKTEKSEILYGFIMYNEEGKVIDGWCADTLHKKTDFTTLLIGSKVSAVNKIDPYCCFLENISENTATSYHKLSDGKEYIIDYRRNDENSNYTITDMQYKDDPCNFTNNLLPQDLQLIS